MLTYLLDANLMAPRLLAFCAVVAAAGIMVLLIRRPARSWLVPLALAILVSLAVTGIALLVVNYWPEPFGDPVALGNWLWIAAGFAGMAVGISSLRRTRPWRKIVAVIAIVASCAVPAVAVNASYGQFPSIRSALGLTRYSTFTETAAVVPRASGESLWKSWRKPDDLPTRGHLYTASIPGTVSGFSGRPASIYLPPAALTAHPPALPVLIALSGQPGDPTSMFVAGHLAQTLDAYAARNDGLAPIVVSPDQLGSPTANPLCVDGPLGNSQTYLTQDVPAWIRSNLGVAVNRRDWAIAGYSQGGTCAIQLGAGFPRLFGSLIDLSGEREPTLGGENTTIERGFQGSRAAYEAAKPLTILAGHRYPDSYAVFGIGASDSHYGPGQMKLFRAAKAAGMKGTFFSIRGASHDWRAAGQGLKRAIAALYPRWGLSAAPLHALP